MSIVEHVSWLIVIYVALRHIVVTDRRLDRLEGKPPRKSWWRRRWL